MPTLDEIYSELTDREVLLMERSRRLTEQGLRKWERGLFIALIVFAVGNVSGFLYYLSQLDKNVQAIAKATVVAQTNVLVSSKLQEFENQIKRTATSIEDVDERIDRIQISADKVEQILLEFDDYDEARKSLDGVLGIFRPKTTLIAVGPASRGFPEGITFS